MNNFKKTEAVKPPQITVKRKPFWKHKAKKKDTRKNNNSRRQSNNSNRNSNRNKKHQLSQPVTTTRHTKPSPQAKNLKVITLGGTETVGQNSNLIEYGDDILVVDYGFTFPGAEHLGIDYLIPNFHYLKANKHKVRGILITHGHLDHTGGLTYLLPELDYPPIYGGEFALALIKERLKEAHMEDKVKLIKVRRNQEVQLGQFKAKFIGVTHSIPNAFSIFVSSPKGNVFFSGDYKIDLKPANEPQTDYTALKELRGKVDLALMESTNASRKGKVLSETEVEQNLENLLRQYDGRIIVSMFSSLVSRIYSTVKIAQRLNRKVFISGRSLQTSLRIAQELGYINIPSDLVLPEEKLKEYPDNKILYICTGSQGERYAALNRIARDEHKYFKLKPTDLVVMSASEIPDNVTQIAKMTDMLLKHGVELIQSDTPGIHSSGHGLIEDMRIMYELIQPKAVMPIHGNLTMRYKNKKNLLSWGADPENVFLTQDGYVWEFINGKWQQTSTIEADPILIDGLGVGDIGEIVLRDREQLSQYGMVVVVLNLSSKGKKLIGRPRFVSRGFVYNKASKELFNELEEIVVMSHREWLNSGKAKKIKDLQYDTEKKLKKFILKKTEREPVILVATV